MNEPVKAEEEIRVIAIKLPFDLQERILTFPFLHSLHSRYPEAEIHFITPRINIEVLNLLPFRAYYHEFDEDEIRTVFDVHRFSVQAKIYNVDLFISLTNSFCDACLGLGLRARKRLGFSDGWKTLLLNIKTQRPIGHHLCEDFFALYKELLGGEIDTRLKVMSRELPPVIQDWDSRPYLAINLAPLRGATIEEEWVDLLNRFTGQHIILFALEDQEKIQLSLDLFLSRLSKKNSYSFYIFTDLIELSKMLAFARGVITYSGAAGALSAYVGSKTILLYEHEDPKITGPLYFLADTMYLTQIPDAAGPSLKERKPFNMEDVAVRAHDFFKLNH